MIEEINSIRVATERAAAFEAAFEQAATLLTQVSGCRAARLFRCLEHPGRYQIRLEWARLEDHVDHYPTTAQAAEVRALLVPLIECADIAHFEPVGLG